MLADILITILLIASTFYMTIVLLRFLLQLARADFYNPHFPVRGESHQPPAASAAPFYPGLGRSRRRPPWCWPLQFRH